MPTFFETTNPTLRCSSSTERACTTTLGRAARTPPRTVASNSLDARIRAATGSTRQAESSARPLRRRAEMVARPARVLIRARKPWVRERRRLLGWYVRLLKGSLRHSFSCMLRVKQDLGPLLLGGHEPRGRALDPFRTTACQYYVRSSMISNRPRRRVCTPTSTRHAEQPQTACHLVCFRPRK